MRKNKKDEETIQTHQDPNSGGRRRFINQALAASAGIAISRFLPHLKTASVYASSGCAPSPLPPNELVNPGEIVSNGKGVLQSVLVVKGEERTVPTVAGNYMLRAYEGYRGFKIDPKERVTKPGVYGPGPTFRASVGDTIQIALLNHISSAQFSETPDGDCDTTTDASGNQLYRDTPKAPAQRDEFPDCFRGSNTTNMHFHGTHVSPNAFSDNVLIEILPDPAATPLLFELMFPTVACKDYPNPQAWKHQDPATTQALQKAIAENQRRLEKLSPKSRQAAQNKTEQDYDEFPQFWAGCFPYCIRPPKFAPPFEMGQAPGTHWYHAHKHGSTTIQMFNGMSGALILEGDYDKTLQQTMPGVQQKVLVLQQFADQPNMLRTGGAGVAAGSSINTPTPLLLVNGQSLPVITMQANEVQWWRIIDATVQAGHGGFMCDFAQGGSASMVFRQIAQDGVQLAWQNYAPQISKAPTSFLLGPGNRVDILVKAPGTPGTATLEGGPYAQGNPTNILTVNVVSGSNPCNTKWPNSQSEYPQMPSFLGDITSVSEGRTLKYQMVARGSTPMINDHTFQEGVVNESMLLGTKQEWTIENYSTVFALHPFHIHVNPFQILEVFDPTGSLSGVLSPSSASFGDWSKVRLNPTNGAFILPGPWVWWDTFPLPLAKDANTPGYIRFRTWFTDFAGKFVDHCHILAHEDRGMMQLIEVVDNKTVYKHH